MSEVYPGCMQKMWSAICGYSSCVRQMFDAAVPDGQQSGTRHNTAAADTG